MPTVVAFECAGGAVVAADRATVREGSLVGENAVRARSFDGYAAGVVDDVEAAFRRFESALRAHRIEREAPSLSTVTRLLAEAVAGDTAAALAGRDDGGVARVRVLSADGGTLSDDCHALGSGAELALGALERTDRAVPLEAAADLARETLSSVAVRDPATGEAVDVVAVASR